MHTAFLSLGTNLGERSHNLIDAAFRLEKAGCKLIATSSIWLTSAWGTIVQEDFYNCALKIETELSPEELLSLVLGIELEMGRVRTVKNAARIIDIDVLFYDDIVINVPGMRIPHPEIAHRHFVLAPLAEIAGDFKHPELNRSVPEMQARCEDTGNVQKI